MRLRNKPWAAQVISEHPEIVVPNPAECKGRWSELFNNQHPIHVEVGTGKGRFVTRVGEKHPEWNVIGMEKYDSVILTGVERLIESPQENVKLIKDDVEKVTDFFAHKEIDRLYINFTDPWPKNRHEKRRLTHEGFLKKYMEVLKDNGEIHFKTDNQGLFEYSLASLSQFGLKLKNVSLDLHNSDLEDNIMTEYEERYVEKGMRIFRLEAYR
ncbi:tRNA (guanosine(46)-N7)-methyltransferase TrmB [Evansella cellulosilytica]|uniref:tRNA (guanine-N(7)-)-methyltransferase n=1 Tax=Evansella cellulosilytica (strain ATCC 21833 / DSM 2522 / FERM P-1141 / JCM 9156 / N-4) TaxID=649639 RepID=E6U190_EVAC2|nr:tRNA (guanosine(46)-N7)-methyltransferase TrmB [Evansella cellulosilytica]ADU31536.1 tRNA (guanine-N(7)-)-methyltransferase [Evansella cellulosilytica DSM 2522]